MTIEEGEVGFCEVDFRQAGFAPGTAGIPRFHIVSIVIETIHWRGAHDVIEELFKDFFWTEKKSSPELSERYFWNTRKLEMARSIDGGKDGQLTWAKVQRKNGGEEVRGIYESRSDDAIPCEIFFA